MNGEETQIEKIRRLARESQLNWRKRQIQDSIDKLRRENVEARPNSHHNSPQSIDNEAKFALRKAANALAQRLRREAETPEQAEARRAANAWAQRLRREAETPEQGETRRAANALAQRIRRDAETPEQTRSRRELNAQLQRLRREVSAPPKHGSTQNSQESFSEAQPESREWPNDNI